MIARQAHLCIDALIAVQMHIWRRCIRYVNMPLNTFFYCRRAKTATAEWYSQIVVLFSICGPAVFSLLIPGKCPSKWLVGDVYYVDIYRVCQDQTRSLNFSARSSKNIIWTDRLVWITDFSNHHICFCKISERKLNAVPVSDSVHTSKSQILQLSFLWFGIGRVQEL